VVKSRLGIPRESGSGTNCRRSDNAISNLAEAPEQATCRGKSTVPRTHARSLAYKVIYRCWPCMPCRLCFLVSSKKGCDRRVSSLASCNPKGLVRARSLVTKLAATIVQEFDLPWPYCTQRSSMSILTCWPFIYNLGGNPCRHWRASRVMTGLPDHLSCLQPFSSRSLGCITVARSSVERTMAGLVPTAS
jgi:hypothetical protein